MTEQEIKKQENLEERLRTTESLLRDLAKQTSRVEEVNVKIKKLVSNAVIPTYARPGDAGMDLTITNIDRSQYGKTIYSFGLAMEIPKGYVGLVFPRSSVHKTDQLLSNCVGVIDSGYRGEITAVFLSSGNTGGYRLGDRACQIIIMPYPTVNFIESEELSETERGTNGYGSTGR